MGSWVSGWLLAAGSVRSEGDVYWGFWEFSGVRGSTDGVMLGLEYE
jgi:hypothetical protein